MELLWIAGLILFVYGGWKLYKKSRKPKHQSLVTTTPSAPKKGGQEGWWETQKENLGNSAKDNANYISAYVIIMLMFRFLLPSLWESYWSNKAIFLMSQVCIIWCAFNAKAILTRLDEKGEEIKPKVKPERVVAIILTGILTLGILCTLVKGMWDDSKSRRSTSSEVCKETTPSPQASTPTPIEEEEPPQIRTKKKPAVDTTPSPEEDVRPNIRRKFVL